MSNTDTGLHKILSDIGRASGKRDSDILLAALRDVETKKHELKKAMDNSPFIILKNQAE